MKLCGWLCLFLALVLGAGRVEGSMLKSDEFVMFFPGLALEQADGSFKVDVDAWVFEEESRRLATAALASYMDIDFDKLSPDQKLLFATRSRFFRTDSERGKQLAVRLGERFFTLPSTDRAGRTHAELSVGRENVKWRDESESPDNSGWISWTLEAPGHVMNGLAGRSRVIPAEGVSVVSDIDDTIKISNVLDKKVLLRNTFIEPFQAVPGMAEWYREMGDGRNAVFHYLSAAPMQLHPALSEFLTDGRFPPGLLHLRESTSWRTVVAGRETTIAHKKQVLTRLLTAFPRRKFILIGDSGENDPEIYADIARAHPGRILAIHIRDVTSEERDAPRYRTTFDGIDPQIWHIRD
jgi:hypothetical protein